jgi:hypothetical protein
MLDMVVQYSKNQREHHAEETTIAMLERITPQARG